MAHKLYPKIIFPINFNQIGLNYEMTYDSFSGSNNVVFLRSLCQAARTDSIQCVLNPGSRKSELVNGGELHLNDGSRYRIERTLASGSFGTTAIVRNIATNELFCLKRQITYDDDDELDCYKEAMMHHILDIKTRQFVDHPSDLIPRLYHVVYSKKSKDVVIYFIMDLMSTSLHNRLATIHTYHGRLFEFIRCIAQIRPTLEILYKNGLYTHGDLHMGNIMYDQITGTYKLIDYGFSRIRIGSGAKSHILELNERHNNHDDASRDLTQLITAFELSHKINELQFTQGSFEHGVQQLIRTVVYESSCPGSGPDHPAHTHDMVGAGWSASYRYFNTHTNLNGTYDTLKEAINQLPRSNATPSSISRRPTVSSMSASAAPRTPRPARAANAAASAAVRQVNQQNPGCMLFLLLMMLFAMRGAVWIYHGKGGRDPTIMNRPLLNHSYQPIISSKHAKINYPAISFPNYSIQMKSRSKNSKTRSNRSLSVSKKNTTRRRSYKVIKTTIEDFDKLSLVSFYHFLRFEAFPDVSQKEKKEMLREAAMVPLQHPDVFEKIVKAVQENDMDQMKDILQKNKLDLSKLSMEIEPYQELWNSILDAYFVEKDYPFDLLQTLLHAGDQVDDFLERYHSANKETKKMMVMQTCITASDAPELMLE